MSPPTVTMSPVARRTPPFVVGFYLVPEFPLMAFAAAIEPLRSANRLSEETLFNWQLFSRDGARVPASNGIELAVHGSIRDRPDIDLMLVCAGLPETSSVNEPVLKWLRSLARGGAAVGGISLGAYWVAQAGLLDGRRCALHWESLAAFKEQFPRIHATHDIFVIDGNRYTCAGGTAALDMMLQVIAARHGRALANDVSEQFMHPRIRETHDPQRMAIRMRVGVANPKLLAAIAAMESAIDEARDVQEIATDVGLSPRQLERLFAKYLRASPSRYYLDLRLAQARSLLLQTTRPILEVAVATGFASASHFSRCYKALYGHKPRDERIAALIDRSKPEPKPVHRRERVLAPSRPAQSRQSARRRQDEKEQRK